MRLPHPTVAPLPCTTRPQVYDALLDAEPDTSTYQTAHAAAVRLCASCPAPCPDQITAASQARTVEAFDDSDWLPAEPAPTVRARREPRRTVFAPIETGEAVVPPRDRPAEWARMASELAAAGRSTAAIAEALCVSEETVTALLTAYRDSHQTAA